MPKPKKPFEELTLEEQVAFQAELDTYFAWLHRRTARSLLWAYITMIPAAYMVATSTHWWAVAVNLSLVVLNACTVPRSMIRHIESRDLPERTTTWVGPMAWPICSSKVMYERMDDDDA